MITSVLQCPLCAGHFVPGAENLECATGHVFDRAREGSVHLLPQRLKSKAKGDSKEMLRARRAVFDEGLYRPLQDAVTKAVIAACPPTDSPVVVDAGCGEGSYLGAFVEASSAAGSRPLALGFDVASYGVKRAAARYKGGHFFVSDIYCGLPIQEASIDVLTNVFSPRHPEEFARVLKPGGTLLSVFPLPGHLAELRSWTPLIAIESGKEDRLVEQMSGSFVKETTTDIEWSMSLSSAQVLSLVDMTPSARHLSAEDRAALVSHDQTRNVSGAVRMLHFSRRANT